MMFRTISRIGPVCAALSFSPSLSAQQISTPFIESSIPFNYQRGRNSSVVDRARAVELPTGVPVGGFTLLPSVRVGLGATDNAYQTTKPKKGDVFVTVQPQLALRSHWSRHQLRLEAGANVVRYAKEALRNEDGWYVNGEGRLEVGSTSEFTVSARSSRLFESRFSAAALANARSSSPYQDSTVGVLAKFEFARLRVITAANLSKFDFAPVATFQSTDISQDFRDQKLGRLTGHIEYGVSSDSGIFIEISAARTRYSNELAPGIPNRDSNGKSAVAGLSFDLSDLIRGSAGVGFEDRSYLFSTYKDVSGITANARLEYFPTRLTTVTVSVRRNVEDSTLGGSSGYFNTVAAVRVDHELLRTLILNAGVEKQINDYRGIDRKGNSFRSSGGARYSMNRFTTIDLNLSYGHRSTNLVDGPIFSETRVVVAARVYR